MKTILLHRPLLCHLPVNFCRDYKNLVLKCNSFSNKASFNCRCIKNEKTAASHEHYCN
ncbi:hypothetical protein C2S52_021123 [Perilla frutescens var. hirtella]|nr:hypothetical protein C2S52_021123 [Perilla frutescens var. hirtella]